MFSSDLQRRMSLQHVPNLGDASAKKLIRYADTAEAVFREKEGCLLKIHGIGKFKIDGPFDPVHLGEAEKELKFITDYQIKCLAFREQNYPETLKHCWDGPILLFQRRNMDLEGKRILSIIGTRNTTNHGIAFCEELVDQLYALDPVIISGFAYGIDITAQRRQWRTISRP